MFNIIPLIAILASLSVILAIIIRKFPQAAALDVANMPAEKHSEVKKHILQSRIERKFRSSFSHLFSGVRRMTKGVGERMGSVKEHLRHMDQLMQKSKQAAREVERRPELTEEQKRLTLILAEADELIKLERYQDAEKKFIEAISLDPKHIEAYRGLGELYLLQNEFDQAKETFIYILKLDPSDHQAHFELAEVHERMGNLEEAVKEVETALEFEPEHIKYLDFLLTAYLEQGNKEQAQAVLERIADINPENNKFDQWREQINEL